MEILLWNTFLKNQNWAYLWINSQKFHTACFYCMPGWGLSKYIKLRCRPLAFISCKAFLKNNKSSRTSLPVSFLQSVLKKNMSLFIFYYLTKFRCLVKFTLWDIVQYVYCNCVLPGCGVIEANKTMVFGKWESEFNTKVLLACWRYKSGFYFFL